MDDFVIPEVGSPEMVDFLCKLERARYDLAKAWIVVVASGDENGEVCHAFGPFEEAEQALTYAGEHDREWCEQEGEEGDWKYAIVPLWGPGE